MCCCDILYFVDGQGSLEFPFSSLSTSKKNVMGWFLRIPKAYSIATSSIITRTGVLRNYTKNIPYDLSIRINNHFQIKTKIQSKKILPSINQDFFLFFSTLRTYATDVYTIPKTTFIENGESHAHGLRIWWQSEPLAWKTVSPENHSSISSSFPVNPFKCIYIKQFSTFKVIFTGFHRVHYFRGGPRRGKKKERKKIESKRSRAKEWGCSKGKERWPLLVLRSKSLNGLRHAAKMRERGTVVSLFLKSTLSQSPNSLNIFPIVTIPLSTFIATNQNYIKSVPINPNISTPMKMKYQNPLSMIEKQSNIYRFQRNSSLFWIKKKIQMRSL